MTVSSEIDRNDYIGTGSTDTYDYTFQIYANTDLLVTQRDDAGVETTLALTTDYTVAGVGNKNGGTITLTAGNLPSGYHLTIRFRTTATQPSDFRNQGGYYPEVVERALDRLTKLVQQLQDEVDRAIKFPETDAGPASPVPTAQTRATRYLVFDGAGDVSVTSGGPGAIPISPYIETLMDDTDAATARTTLGAVAKAGDTITGGLAVLGGNVQIGDASGGGDLYLARQSNAYGYIVRPNVAGYKRIKFSTNGDTENLEDIYFRSDSVQINGNQVITSVSLQEFAASNWTERANPKNFQLNGITYGNGLFVAVGNPDGVDAYIVTSRNSIETIERANPKNVSLNGVTYGNSLFVAVGNADGSDSYIVTSTDGITWTERANPKNINLLGITYANGLFVAVGAADGTDAYIITSTDGITWTERANPKNFSLQDVTYGNGIFVAVGAADGTDAYIITSTDGITWTERANPKNINLLDITYANGLFVAVGAADGTDAYIITSTDGITWTERANPKNFLLYGITYGNSLFVAIGAIDGPDAYIVTSTDGITWTERANPKNVVLLDVTYDNGIFVAVGAADGTDAYWITSLYM